MWSFACIIIELFIGFPIFPGESENDQLARIMEYKGIPPINVMEESTRSGYFFSDNLDPLPVKNSRGGIRKPCTKSLTQLLDCKNKHFIRFLDSCLHWDPELRLTPEEALCHEWINEGFFAAHPIYLQHRILNSQYQSSVDIDGRKIIKNHEFDEILKLNTKETKTSNQYRSVNSRDIESKNDKRKSVSEFLEFLSKDHFNKTNRLNRDKTEYRVYNQLCPDDDEIIKLEEQMYNLDKPKKPDSSKRKSTKKHGNLIDY